MAKTVTFEDPSGEGKPVKLKTFEVPKDLPDYDQRVSKIP